MITTFITESGSVYELDDRLMTWKRVFKTARGGQTRSSGGHLIKWPSLKVGECAFLQDDSVLQGAIAHAVVTTPIVVIERSGEENAANNSEASRNQRN